jgi:hypothetical protein
MQSFSCIAVPCASFVLSPVKRNVPGCRFRAAVQLGSASCKN